MRNTNRITIVLLLAIAGGGDLQAGDWPMWRYDAQRGASTPVALPDKLQLLWTRELAPARPAWPRSQTNLQFDLAPEPVVLGGRIFVPSSANDSVTAYETATGKLLWQFFSDGPVRFAPVGYQDRVYFVSDDGHLYCLGAADGKLLWKVNGGPALRPVLGSDRLVSSWPARGGLVLHEGKIYFAASIWSFMGIFIHAVDGETGEIVWTNSGDGTNFTIQPHGAGSFATVVPQGHLVVASGSVVVPGGRTMPAVYDAKTGAMKYFQFDKRQGGHDLSASEDTFFVGDAGYELAGGERIAKERPAVLDRNVMVFLDETSIRVSSAAGRKEVIETTGRRGRKETHTEIVRDELFRGDLKDDAPQRIFLKAGPRLYGIRGDTLLAIDLPEANWKEGKPRQDATAAISWQAKIEGKVWTMLAADDKLFVVTEEGRLHAFGAEAGEPKKYPLERRERPAESDAWTAKTKALLAARGPVEGYCLALGLASGRLVDELLRQSSLHVIVVDPDAQKIEAFRRRMDAAGVYGTRVAAHVGDPATFPFPPYLASLVVSEDATAAGFDRGDALIKNAYQALRPYGGSACFALSLPEQKELARRVDAAELPSAIIKQRGEWTCLVREGSLPDTDDWTHQYGNAAQTAVSKDKQVKAPLGLLWFGGPPNDDVLPRHGHGPSPQVAGGRLVIEGAHMLRAVDVYTGRLLWQKTLTALGKYYDTTRHFAGAGEIGSNYVTLPDAVYVVYGPTILKLNAATGEVEQKFYAPADERDEETNWGHIAVWEDLLVATTSPVDVDTSEDADSKSKDAGLTPARYASGSRRLVVLDRSSGELLWTRDAEFNFRHNNIAVGSGKIFAIDGLSEAKRNALRRRGLATKSKPKLYAFDVRSGDVAWSTDRDVFGTFLNYSAEHDIVLKAGSHYRDRAKDENTEGMVAYRGADGKVLWHNKLVRYGGPCLLWRDKIITNGLGGFALDIHTGQATGWEYNRQYGCNTAIGSEHLLTFRSGAAGVYDLTNDGGTGNLGGFRSSCTANLIAAGGVLNAPDYTRTCSCAYQNQTSLALVHMPEAEMWTFGAPAAPGQIGINFGAPGDRRAPNGTLWTDWPSLGGRSVEVPVRVEPEAATYWRHHASRIENDVLPWIVSSGVTGAERIVIRLSEAENVPARRYTVKLYFAEVEPRRTGERVFDVAINGKPLLTDLDAAAEAGLNRGLVREIQGVEITNDLEVTFTPAADSMLSGIEILLEPGEEK